MRFFLCVLTVLAIWLPSDFVNAAESTEASALDEKQKDSAEESKGAIRRAYHFGIGAAQPQTIGNQYNHYEKMYGTAPIYPELWGEYYFLGGLGFDVGIRTKLGYYHDSGHPVQGVSSSDLPLERDLTDDEIARSQSSDLSIIPMQISLALNFNPFESRFISLQAWHGKQFSYVQNSMGASLNAENAEGSTSFLNKGFNRETVSGAAISIKINALDSRASHSLMVYGIKGIYVTPFIEITETEQAKMGVFDRRVAGIMFTFETTRRGVFL